MPSGQREESEARTRRSRIDPQLRSQGWTIVPFAPACPPDLYACHAVTEFPTAKGPADYALFVDGQSLGIADAKTLGTWGGSLLQWRRIRRDANFPLSDKTRLARERDGR